MIIWKNDNKKKCFLWALVLIFHIYLYIYLYVYLYVDFHVSLDVNILIFMLLLNHISQPLSSTATKHPLCNRGCSIMTMYGMVM